MLHHPAVGVFGAAGVSLNRESTKQKEREVMTFARLAIIPKYEKIKGAREETDGKTHSTLELSNCYACDGYLSL